MPFMLSAKREVLQGMKRYEVQRQENIKELVYTERTHVHRLKIMRYVSPNPKLFAVVRHHPGNYYLSSVASEAGGGEAPSR